MPARARPDETATRLRSKAPPRLRDTRARVLAEGRLSASVATPLSCRALSHACARAAASEYSRLQI